MTLVLSTRPVRVADVMTTPALSVSPETSVWATWSLMTRTGLHHLAVTVDDRCVGVLDDRAVFAQWPMGPLALRRHSVRAIMRPRTSCLLPDADLQAAATVMMHDSVDAVPVVDDDGHLVGMVTTGDIAAAVAAHGVYTEAP